jgi:hypothetical protein
MVAVLVKGANMAERPTKIAFERRYSDDSGVQFAVRLDGNKIEFESINEISFPCEEIDWLIACLLRIKNDLAPPVHGEGEK